ncbi:hypothetical protein TSUD_233690 [Trifolium subterraneum]|uniref:Uncharacterized protein n=1 Tax=Trifolium subterraneum TaxID=3900 RepID=A0A2Z6M483_TRISU|nr:hypothetical protein TSUD_233690 [Trifolium subterraneum]
MKFLRPDLGIEALETMKLEVGEVDIHSGEDIPKFLKELENFGCDLYIVGEELGVIGDMLASDNFGSRSSVLVVQQYGYGGMVLGKQHNHETTNNDV